MDAVIKIGGSVLRPDNLKKLTSHLDKLRAEFSFVIIPGGGEYADLVRRYHQTYHLSDDTAHWMAILSENILGFLLLEHLQLGVPAFSLSEISAIMLTSKIPVFMPFRHLLNKDPLPHSWDVTSDSIAAYFAESLHAEKLILLKDVDGIYTSDPKHSTNQTIDLIEKVDLNRADLSNFHRLVDKYLPIILKKYQRTCYIINGLFPERLEKVLKNQKTLKTIIEI